MSNDVTTHVVEVNKGDQRSGCYRLALRLLGANGEARMVGLCGHDHALPEDAERCPDAAQNLSEELFRPQRPVTAALRDDAVKWLRDFEAKANARRFAGMTHTTLEVSAQGILNRVAQLLSQPAETA